MSDSSPADIMQVIADELSDSIERDKIELSDLRYQIAVLRQREASQDQ